MNSILSKRRMPTEGRVEANTARRWNDEIFRETAASVLYFARNPHHIDRRLRELDREWDVERVLEANAATVTIASFLLGKVWRPARLLPLVVGGFLLQHAYHGWCPPLPILRRMRVRTTREINHERYALKVLRGDFGPVPEQSPDGAARYALAAAATCPPG